MTINKMAMAWLSEKHGDVLVLFCQLTGASSKVRRSLRMEVQGVKKIATMTTAAGMPFEIVLYIVNISK